MVAIKAYLLAWTLSNAVPALAAALEAPRGYAAPTTRCYTKLCTKSTKYKTSWSTSYSPCTKTVTVTSTSTSTPSAITSTDTTSETLTITEPTRSETQTSTIRETEIDTITVVDTATATATSTVSTSSVSTVGTPAGFVPVQTSLPGASCDGSCGTNPVQKRSDYYASLESRTSRNPAKKNPFYKGKASAQKYPQSVRCVRYTRNPKCSTKTITVTSIANAPTPTSSLTITSTITTTFAPSATTTESVTVTDTTTSTARDSTTVTVTTTATVTTSTTTVYAACATNNLASLYNNQGVTNFNEGAGPQATITTVTASSPYDCCVANILSTSSSQFFAFQIGATTCYLVSGNSCPAGSSSKTFTVNNGAQAYVFGNGLCGEMVP